MNDNTRQSAPPPDPGTDRGAEATAGGPALHNETLAQTPADVERAAAALPPTAPPMGAVPGYEILGELGRGGMGVVYKALHLRLNRIVALKVMLAGVHADPREIIRFLAEAEAVAAIRHPNVIQVFDTGEADGRPYMAVECLEGGSLSARIRAAGTIDPRIAAALVEKIARGVQAAHDRGIVHRDLKPHNVLLDAPPAGSPPGAWGEPKVMDFGLAKRGGTELTQTGAVLGTPAYMSPEQARGATKSVGPAADVYALGVILYECLTGTVPFTGEDAWAVIRQVMMAEPVPAARRAPGVPRELDLICRKCLEKHPAERYPSAGSLADDLRRFLDGEALVGARTGAWYAARKAVRRRWRPAAAALAVVLVAVLVAHPLDRLFHPKPEGEPGDAKKEEPPEAAKKEDPLVTLRREEVHRRVNVLRRAKPAPDRAPPHPLARLPELPPPDLAPFRVLADDRVVDMRGWRPGPAGDPDLDCFVIYQTRRDMAKVAPAAELRAEMRTTGRDVFLRALRPDPDAVKALAAEKPGFVGEQAMKVRQLVYDVSRVPVDGEFTLQYTSTFWNTLQTPEERWFGVIGYEGAFKTSMLMLFPPDRPFRDYQLRVAETRAADQQRRKPVPYTGPVITFAADDKSWLYWEIPNPQAHRVYRVDWTW